MSVEVLLGIQWGDEGKAKIVDFLSKKADMVIRYQGGANAGHTVYAGGQKFVFHLVPAGVIYGKMCLVGSGVVIDIEEFFSEIKMLEEKGVDASRVFVDKRAHIVMPYHKMLDMADEEKNGGKIGTTGRGIGPAYSDRVARTGVRICDMEDPVYFRNRLKEVLKLKNFLLVNYYNKPEVNADEICDKYIELYEKLKPRIVDGHLLGKKMINENKNILFEGAQGTMLDVDYGTYPFVTSSNTISAAAAYGSGIAVNKIGKIFGVFKAYTTRVGNGVFPTELFDETSEKIRKNGKEFGATTGRPRRCGWLDLVALKYAIDINGITDLVVTKLDILKGFDKIKLGVGYECDGVKHESFPASASLAEKIKPVYREFDCWDSDVSQVERYEDLPKECREYLEFIEEYTETKISLVSVGPEREKTFEK